MAVFYNTKLLDKLSYDNTDSVFTLENIVSTDSINIEFIPKKIKAELDINKYDLFIFDNKSLIAENDIFLLYETTVKKDIGWIFPISVLESNENDYANKDFFNQFRFLAYQKLLSSTFSLKAFIKEKKDLYSISELFGSNRIILIVSKEDFGAENIFEINDYLPSLATSGYFINNENELIYSCPKNYIVENFRGKKKIKISKAVNEVYNLNFSKKLYQNYLKTLDHHLIRFHLLYQIIEFHITEAFNVDFDNLLEKYNNRDISKNDFIEKFKDIRNEREKIRKILKTISPNASTFEKEILINIQRDCKDFLLEFGDYDKNEIGDLLYDVRNVIVHNYRKIKDENIQLLNEITFEFEILINYLMTKSP